VARVHPTAVVDPRAKLAGSVAVGPFAVIGEDVELADGVEVGAHVVIRGKTSIGCRTRIFPFALVGAEPQVRGPAGEPAALAIGEDNVLREFVSIHVGTPAGGGCTRIGDDNLIMNHVHVAHDCEIASHCEITSYTGLGGHVVVGDHAVLGGKTGVHQFVRIGESVFTAGNSMLTKDAAPFTRVAGDRARYVGLNGVGLQRRGLAAEVVAALKHAMHLIFQSKLLLEPALERVEAECCGAAEVARLVAFLRQSERGFIR
jgi:UDP-N-acetylglucosamine acyltransferase